ncbi:chemotaxis protein CheW [Shewanella waksmanii]|uniref:chemotaxis protein CheW n=1 Tax=Shewanella waksmanii TaxID=213783 RepID=UPI003734D45E
MDVDLQQALSYAEDENRQQADFLSFRLGAELYGIAIHSVEEIRVWEQPTPLPRSPVFVKGVINLRGMIVPVIDLRLRFGIGKASYHPTTVVLVMRRALKDKEQLMGIVVDSVADVVTQGSNELHPAMGESAIAAFVVGMLNLDQQVMALLDTDELMNLDKLLEVEAANGRY